MDIQRYTILSPWGLPERIHSGGVRGLLILKATDRVTVSTIVGVHIGIGAIEVEVPGIGARYRTRPIVAVGANIVERAISAIAVARRGQ